MIYYLMLFCEPIVNCLQSVAQKQYNLKNEKPNVILFSAVTSAIGLCFFLITSGFRLEFKAALIPYSLTFAIAYSAAWIGTVLAVRYGSVAISTMIICCSLIFPTGYGVMHGEPVTPMLVTGVILLLAAFVLVNMKKEKGIRFSWKWFGCVMIAFLGNGTCSVMSNMQKRALGDAYSHEYMILALSIASVLLLCAAFAASRDIMGDFRRCFRYSLLNGGSNGMLNLLMLILIGNIPNTVLYPTTAALNMLATFLLAFFAYGERFGKMQYIGYALGTVSVVLLNL